MMPLSLGATFLRAERRLPRVFDGSVALGFVLAVLPFLRCQCTAESGA
jgi:hypothetical protein